MYALLLSIFFLLSLFPLRLLYCISDALIAAVRGDWENGLFFCGANVGDVCRMSTVKEQMDQIVKEWREAL